MGETKPLIFPSIGKRHDIPDATLKKANIARLAATCHRALCGLRILTPDGNPAVEAVNLGLAELTSGHPSRGG